MAEDMLNTYTAILDVVTDYRTGPVQNHSPSHQPRLDSILTHNPSIEVHLALQASMCHHSPSILLC